MGGAGSILLVARLRVLSGPSPLPCRVESTYPSFESSLTLRAYPCPALSCLADLSAGVALRLSRGQCGPRSRGVLVLDLVASDLARLWRVVFWLSVPVGCLVALAWLVGAL
jgi:hypothetical protein